MKEYLTREEVRQIFENAGNSYNKLMAENKTLKESNEFWIQQNLEMREKLDEYRKTDPMYGA